MLRAPVGTGPPVLTGVPVPIGLTLLLPPRASLASGGLPVIDAEIRAAGHPPVSARRVLLPLGAAVCLSLFGDLTLYAVLATQREVVGLSLGTVGVMLAANRLIRIPGNPIVGTLFDRRGRRWLFILGMLLGVLSTAAYGLVRGIVPFLVARLMWGTAWMLINIGGTTMILDVSTPANRGRLVGNYNAWMLLGFAGGPLLGGFLVDALGFRPAMLVCAACTAVGLLLALVALPETAPPPSTDKGAACCAPTRHCADGALQTPAVSRTAGVRTALPDLDRDPSDRGITRSRARGPAGDALRSTLAGWREGLRIYGSHPRLLSAALLYLLVLFVGEGIALSTLNLWLEARLGTTVTAGVLVVGIAAASGFLSGTRALIAGLTGPFAGRLSDRALGRGAVAAVGMLLNAAGLVWLAFTASPLTILLAVWLGALGDGTVRATLTATMGDAAPAENKGVVLGIYATIGDIGSTLGPVMAFLLLPVLGLQRLYITCAIVFALGMSSVWWFQRRRDRRRAVLNPDLKGEL